MEPDPDCCPLGDCLVCFSTDTAEVITDLGELSCAAVGFAAPANSACLGVRPPRAAKGLPFSFKATGVSASLQSWFGWIIIQTAIFCSIEVLRCSSARAAAAT